MLSGPFAVDGPYRHPHRWKWRVGILNIGYQHQNWTWWWLIKQCKSKWL